MKRVFVVFVVVVVVAAVAAAMIHHFIENRNVRVVLVGDLLLDRGVEEVIVDKGSKHLFEGVRDVLNSADVAFGNLECALTDVGVPLLKNRNLIFKASPEHAASLEWAGFDILNLANNHSMDYGREGLISTINALDAFNIKPLGVGMTRSDAIKPIYIKRKGLVIGFLGYSTFPPEGYFYLNDKPDIAHLDLNTIGDEIKAVKENCDFLVVSFHWGKEFDFYAGESQKILARTAIDSGADVIAGHHPHVLQGIEEYKEGLIIYSLGNFIFDRQIPKGTDESMIISLVIKNKKLENYEIIPVTIEGCRPIKAEKPSANDILERIHLYSE